MKLTIRNIINKLKGYKRIDTPRDMPQENKHFEFQKYCQNQHNKFLEIRDSILRTHHIPKNHVDLEKLNLLINEYKEKTLQHSYVMSLTQESIDIKNNQRWDHSAKTGYAVISLESREKSLEQLQSNLKELKIQINNEFISSVKEKLEKRVAIKKTEKLNTEKLNTKKPDFKKESESLDSKINNLARYNDYIGLAINWNANNKYASYFKRQLDDISSKIDTILRNFPKLDKTYTEDLQRLKEFVTTVAKRDNITDAEINPISNKIKEIYRSLFGINIEQRYEITQLLQYHEQMNGISNQLPQKHHQMNSISNQLPQKQYVLIQQPARNTFGIGIKSNSPNQQPETNRRLGRGINGTGEPSTPPPEKLLVHKEKHVRFNLDNNKYY